MSRRPGSSGSTDASAIADRHTSRATSARSRSARPSLLAPPPEHHWYQSRWAWVSHRRGCGRADRDSGDRGVSRRTPAPRTRRRHPRVQRDGRRGEARRLLLVAACSGDGVRRRARRSISRSTSSASPYPIDSLTLSVAHEGVDVDIVVGDVPDGADRSSSPGCRSATISCMHMTGRFGTSEVAYGRTCRSRSRRRPRPGAASLLVAHGEVRRSSRNSRSRASAAPRSRSPTAPASCSAVIRPIPGDPVDHKSSASTRTPASTRRCTTLASASVPRSSRCSVTLPIRASS